MPSSKHICWDQRLVCDFPCDSNSDSKMVSSNIIGRGVESEPDFASYSYSFPDYGDMSMSSHDGAKTYISYPKAQASPKNGTPSTFSDDKSSQIGPYSLESRSLTKESSEFGPPSVSEDLHSLYREYGLHLTDSYGVRLLEIGGDADCSFTEYRNEVIEGCMDEGVDNQLYLNEATDSNYVLSSGRWPVNQGSFWLERF